MAIKSNLYAATAAIALLCGRAQAQVSPAVTGVALLDSDATFAVVPGHCTQENGFDIFQTTLAGDAALEDDPDFNTAQSWARTEVSVRSDNGTLDSDALETIDINELARGKLACYGLAATTRSAKNAHRHALILNETALTQERRIGISVAALGDIAIAHETGHAFTNEQALARLADQTGSDFFQMREALADAYMLVRLKTAEPSLSPAVDRFLDWRASYRAPTEDYIKDHVTRGIMTPAMRRRLDSLAAGLQGRQLDDKTIFAKTAQAFAESLTAAPSAESRISARAALTKASPR